MRKDSILLLTNAYPDFSSSYRGVFVRTLATLMQNRGFNISVVTPKIYRGSLFFEEQNGIRVYRFPFFAGNKLLIEYEKIPYFRMIVYYLTGFFLTAYVLVRHRCHLIHAHWAIPTGPIGVWVGALLNRPVIVTIHGSDLGMATKRSGFLKRIFLHVCKKADHITCVSEGMKNVMIGMGLGEEKITVSPMGVGETFFERERKGLTRREMDPWVVLSNRNLQPVYNVSQLIRAIPWVLKGAPNTKFLIAGEGGERERLESEVQSLNIASSVQFMGKVPHDEMPDLLSRTDIYVSTSLSDGTSVSLLEAMACGAFPVVTDIPANREWIEDGNNGFLVPTEDEVSLAKRILEAMNQRELVASARQKNREIVEKRAHLKNQVEDLFHIYSNHLK